MIEFYSETDFKIEDTKALSHWISEIILHENHELGDLTYVFCDDAYLHKLNLQFLNHDTLTDIISFDNSLGKQIHGVLHFCGYKDKTKKQQETMSCKENEALDLRTFS